MHRSIIIPILLLMRVMILFCCCLLYGLTGVKAQSSADTSRLLSPPAIKLAVAIYDIGDVPQGTEVKNTFVITNCGDAPLEIKEVISTRANATAEWTSAPITPGKKGTVTAYVNTEGREGAFKQSFYIRSNAANNTCGLGYELVLKGYVNTLATPETVKE